MLGLGIGEGHAADAARDDDQRCLVLVGVIKVVDRQVVGIRVGAALAESMATRETRLEARDRVRRCFFAQCRELLE